MVQRSGQKKSNPEYGSDVIVDLMKAFDVEYAAFNPGATFRGIHDSIVNYGGNVKPEVIFCCHEEIAVAIAHGYGKVQGKPMAALTHNIVGLQHATMAIFNAWCDRVPVLVMGGTGPMDTTKRRPWIDWIHTALVQGNQVRDYVKWDDQPHNLASVPASFIRGYRIATTEPMAPVYLCFDVLLQEEGIKEPVTVPDLQRFNAPAPVQANPEALKHAAKLLANAKAPLAIADFFGRHPAAVGSLIELAEFLSMPVVDKANRFNFPNTHPLDVSEGALELMKKADVILALDVQDLHGALTAADIRTRKKEYCINPAAKIIHISLNDMLIHAWASDFENLESVDCPISADSSVALPELLRLCREYTKDTKQSQKLKAARLRETTELHDRLRKKWSDEAGAAAGRSGIAPSFLAAELWETVKKEDYALVNGTANGWARRLWSMTKPYHMLGKSNGGAGLGYGMGASIGAALAHRKAHRTCINIQNDGDLLMTTSALWTAAHHKIPLLTVLYNNQSFYNSEQHQTHIANFRKRPAQNAGIGTHLDNPTINFAEIAKGYGMHSDGPISKSSDLRPALERALKFVKEKNMPALVDVVTEAR